MIRRFLILSALLIAACSSPAPESLREGSWRAEVDLPGGTLPFFIEIERADDGWHAWYLNGDERQAVDAVRVEGDRVRLDMTAFNTWIDARLVDGALLGELTLVKRYDERQVMPFRATPGGVHRFSDAPVLAGADVGGRWRVTFTDDDGVITEAVGEFQQFGHEVLGTFLTPLGDYRFLAGELQSGRLRLSTFDGAHAFLFDAQLREDGSLSGDFWSGTAWHESWVAQRDEYASLPDADGLTTLAEGYEAVSFSFPDTEGHMVSLDDPRFAGKVVVITLAGSWCPNCHDEAAMMAPFYQRYREQGLEVVALMYEHLEDDVAARRQVQRFRERYDIEYVTLLAGVSDKALAAETLPMLQHVLAFPTTLFIDRSGALRRIHTGFSGPGTGEHYLELVASYTATVEALLAEAP